MTWIHLKCHPTKCYIFGQVWKMWLFQLSQIHGGFAGFVWDRANFLQGSWEGVMLWICSENSVDNMRMSSLLLSWAYTLSRPCLPLTPPHQWVEWGAPEARMGHNFDSWPQLTKDIPHLMASCSVYKAVGRRRECLERWNFSYHVYYT